MKFLKIISIYFFVYFSVIGQNFYSGEVYNYITHTYAIYYPVFLYTPSNTKFIAFTDQNGQFSFFTDSNIVAIKSFGYFNGEIHYYNAVENTKGQYRIEIKHDVQFYPDTFRISGRVFNTLDHQLLKNFPVSFYTDISMTEKFTVYTANNGIYHFTMTLPPGEELQLVSELVGFCDDFIYYRDTITVSDVDFWKDFYVCYNPEKHTKIYISGQVFDTIHSSPIKNQDVIISVLNSQEEPHIVRTVNGGFFFDSLLIDTADCQGISVSVCGVYESMTRIYSDTLNIQPGQTSYYLLLYIGGFTYEDIFNFIFFINKKNVFFYPIISEQEKIKWDFDDGTMFLGNSAFHDYDTEGVYYVKMTNLDETKSVVNPVVIKEDDNRIVLSGNIFTGRTQTLPRGKLLLFLKENDQYTYYKTLSVKNGYFRTDRVLRGENLILSVPVFEIDTLYFPKYLPTYLGGVTFWNEAKVIDLQTDTSLNLQLQVNGKPYYGQRKIEITIQEKGIIYQNDLVVTLYDEYFNPLDFRGNFGQQVIFDNLPNGIYYLYLQIPGLDQIPLKVDLREANSKVTYTIGEDYVWAYTSEAVLKGSSYIYPNPFSEVLKLPAEILPANVDIYEVSGKRVFSQYVDHSILNLSQLKTGEYIINISGNNFYLREKIVKK